MGLLLVWPPRKEGAFFLPVWKRFYGLYLTFTSDSLTIVAQSGFSHMTKIFHNPQCKKSREALALLNEKGEQPEVVEYLRTPPSREELQEIIKLLQITPYELVRKSEAIYKELYRGRELSAEEWIDAMVTHPRLIERPIVIKNGQAVIGRPPELVKGIL